MFILLVKTRFVLYTLPKTKPIGPLLAPRFREFEAVPLPWTTLTGPHKSPRIGSRGFIGLLDSRNGHSANLAMNHNPWPSHLGVDEHAFASYFDVHQGYQFVGEN